MRLSTRPAFTLVELLIALTLSLLLLLGVAELFQRVGGAMNETRSAMSASAHINEAALRLRQDLAGIDPTLAAKPKEIAEGKDVGDGSGYMEIIEGPDTIESHPYVDDEGEPDTTVGDVDDIICFSTKLDSGLPPFRGVVRSKIEERKSAEITYFVRGGNLHRRIRLIDDVKRGQNNSKAGECNSWADLKTEYPTPGAGQYVIVKNDETTDGAEQRYDAVENGSGNWEWTTLYQHDDLARRARRFGHDGLADNYRSESFPYPLYKDDNAGWQYLRMPTIEETDFWRRNDIKYWKTDSWSSLDSAELTPDPDLWNQPYFFPNLQDKKSGSLKLQITKADGSVDRCVSTPRSPQAGEDIILTNVLSFDVKVWDTNTHDFVDLGTEGTIWAGPGNQEGLNYPEGLRTWDSWTLKYKKEDETVEPPPYTESLGAIRITIRCFDPASRIIKQVTVVHRFKGE